MLGHLIRKEILDHLLSLRFMILAALGAVIVWMSLYDGYAFYCECLNDYRQAQIGTEERIRRIQTAGNWVEVQAKGYLVHKPPTPMSMFVRGLEPYLGRSVRMGGEVRRPEQSPAAMEPILGLYPSLDLEQVVRMVLSLFILLLTYDAISGEKEIGTLRLMGSCPVSRIQLLAGKFLGIVIPALLAFGLPLLLGIGVLLLSPDVRLDNPDLARLGLILVGFCLYLMAAACFGLFASSLTHRAATSFVVSMAFWGSVVVVLPRLSLIAADAFKPAPSVHELQTEKTAIENDALKQRWDLQAKWMKEHFLAGVSGQPPTVMEAYWLHYSQTRRDFRDQKQVRFMRLDEAFRNAYNSRLGLAILLARFSPAFALGNAAIRLAGTGTARYQRFREAADEHWERYSDWFSAAKDLDRLKGVYPAKYGTRRWDASGMPPFAYTGSRTEGGGETALTDLGILCIWGTVFFLGAYICLLRYDVR